MTVKHSFVVPTKAFCRADPTDTERVIERRRATTVRERERERERDSIKPKGMMVFGW